MTRAFGLDLVIPFRFPGRPARPERSSRPARATHLSIARRQDVLEGAVPITRLWEARRPDGRVDASLDTLTGGGYLFVATGYGAFSVSDDGTVVRCAPVRTAAWRWQRYVIGQVLPLAAVLHGLEVFHASVVRVDTSAVALTGPSGAGKSSVAAALLARGHELVADDVMVVDPGAGGSTARLEAEPGWGLTSIRHTAAARLPLGHLGRVIGRDDEATRFEVPVAPGPVPLAAYYVLGRERGPGPLVEPMAPVDPRLLLASSYNFVIRSPERLVRHLDACTRIAATAVVARATVRPGVGPSDLAAAVEAHAADLA